MNNCKPLTRLMIVLTLSGMFAFFPSEIARGEDWPVAVKINFDDASMADWKPTDPKAWRFADSDEGKGLELFAQSAYKPPVRSPINYVLLDTKRFGDFDLLVSVKSLTRDYGHRDMCLIFGYQDPSHFYYVHLAKEADAHAQSIFLVDGKPRVSIATERTKGVDWGKGWHKVRLLRIVETGETSVFFDDLEKPIMKTVDKTFGLGKIGLGSFDDVGQFDDLLIKAPISK